MKTKILALALLLAANVVLATPTESFSKAKKLMMNVYSDHQETIYCGAQFDSKKANHL